ncbi:MAG: LacI family DNA-binding transcriptional regulator [Clostridia bacterium]|nr:LacI family DNA-binding transcriptional regulator [Clostridia bacterium]
MATIKDVARESGLSIATISKYINGGSVLEPNRLKIERAISKLGYSVNRAARSLKTKRTMTVGVLLPSLDVSFFANIFSEVEALLLKAGYDLIVASFNKDPKQELKKLQFLVERNVDAIVLVPEGVSRDDISSISPIVEKKIPLVVIDRYIADMQSDFVLVNCRAACNTAVSQFISFGHERIAILLGPNSVYTAADRLSGYMDALSESGLCVNPEWIKSGEYTVESGYNMMNELMDMPHPPTAVLCTNNELTMGAVTAARERNMTIPDDLSFIGFDDMQLTRIFNPPITIVTQPIHDIAVHTTQLLLDRLKGDYSDFPRAVHLDASIISCQSVRTVAQ